MKIESRPPTLPHEVEGASAVAPQVATTAATKPEPGTFEKLLARASDDVNAHEHHLHGLAHSGQAPALGPEELLALQSDVYRYSATVDLTSKVVAQGTQGVQTVLKSGQ